MVQLEIEINNYSFPFRLYYMLEDATKQGFEDVVSWLPDGNGFVIHNRETFEHEIMRVYFSHTQWKSFLRQLNFYNFQRVSKRCRGMGSCYTHPFLVRGDTAKCKLIRRSKKEPRFGKGNEIISHENSFKLPFDLLLDPEAENDNRLLSLMNGDGMGGFMPTNVSGNPMSLSDGPPSLRSEESSLDLSANASIPPVAQPWKPSPVSSNETLHGIFSADIAEAIVHTFLNTNL